MLKDPAYLIVWTKVHSYFYVTLRFCMWSREPLKKPLHLPDAVSFHTGEFSSSRIHAAVEKMRNPVLFCGLWYLKRDEISIHLQVFGVVDKIPGRLLSFVELQRALWFANSLCIKCLQTGLCQHVGWMKDLSTTRIHSLRISPFSPQLNYNKENLFSYKIIWLFFFSSSQNEITQITL